MDFIVLVFDLMGYKFRCFKEKDGKFRPKIGYGNILKYLFKNSIVGVDVIDVHRFDFNFKERTIILYCKTSYIITKSKPQLLIDVFYMGIICVMLGFGYIILCPKKKESEIKPVE